MFNETRVAPTGVMHVSVRAQSFNSFGSPVTVTCTGGPPGTTCAPFNGNPVLDFMNSYSTTFDVQTTDAPPGDYTLTFTGVSGSLVHSSTITIQVVDLAVTPPSSLSATIPVGGGATFDFAIASVNGFSGQVSFGCEGVTSAISCTFNPASVNLAAGSNTSTQLMIRVVSRPTAAPASATMQSPSLELSPVGLLWAVGLIAVALGLSVTRRENPRVAGSVTALLLALCITIAACGGGSGGSGPPPPPPPPPPPSPVTVNVTVRAYSTLVTKTLSVLTITVP